jgi:hypothetical protein
MATVSPACQSGTPANMQVILWEALATGDTINAAEPQGLSGLAGSVQFTGTFGGATITLTGSNDGTNFVTLEDTNGEAISVTAAGLVDFATACRYIKPGISGGTGDDVDVTVVLRG